MYLNFRTVLLIGSFACFALDACWKAEKPPAVRLTPLGLALFTASLLVPAEWGHR